MISMRFMKSPSRGRSFSRALNCPARGEDREHDAEQQPYGHAEHAEESLYQSREKSHQDGADGRQHRYHAALPHVIERKAAVPCAAAADADGPHQAGGERVKSGGSVAVSTQAQGDLGSRHPASPESSPGGKGSQAERERVLDRLFTHTCSTRPSESSAASATASDIVGWAWMARLTSSTVYSFSRATVNS